MTRFKIWIGVILLALSMVGLGHAQNLSSEDIQFILEKIQAGEAADIDPEILKSIDAIAPGLIPKEIIDSLTGDGAGGDPDQTPPVLNTPSELSGQIPVGQTTVLISIPATAVDDRDGAVPVILNYNGQSIPANFAFPVGDHLVVASATDAAGNKTTNDLYVRVTQQSDTEPPQISAPSPQDVTIPVGAQSANVSIQATAQDNVDGAVTPQFFTSGSPIPQTASFGPGQYQVVVRATDKAGNTANREITIRVTKENIPDNEPPQISAPNPQDVTIPVGAQSTNITIEATAQDNVDGSITPQFFTNGTQINQTASFGPGQYQVVVRATDKAGNTANREITIRVTKDKPEPITIAAPASRPAQLVPPVVVEPDGEDTATDETDETDEADETDDAEDTAKAGELTLEVAEAIEISFDDDGAYVPIEAFAWDKNGEPLEPQVLDENGTPLEPPYFFDLGDTAIRVRAEDAEGNAIEKTVNVKVVSKTTKPTEKLANAPSVPSQIFTANWDNPEEWKIEDQYILRLEDGLIGAASGSRESLQLLSEELGFAPSAVDRILSEENNLILVNAPLEEIVRLQIERSDIVSIEQDRWMVPLQQMTDQALAETAFAYDGRGWFSRQTDHFFGDQDVRVYIVDAGLSQTNDEIGELVSSVRNEAWGTGGDSAPECNFHGTAIASLIAGRRLGMAGPVELVDVTVAECPDLVSSPEDIQIKMSNVIRALNWIDKREGGASDKPVVINMSLGMPALKQDAELLAVYDAYEKLEGTAARSILNLKKSLFRSSLDEILERLSQKAVVVVAAGNQPMDACEIVPANSPSVLTVGGATRDRTLWPSSATGPCVNVFAQAVDLEVTDTRTSGNSMASGTSFSAAIISGAIAKDFSDGKTRAEIMQSYDARPKPQ